MILSKNAPESARITAEFLRDNRLVIIPTDTIYGFSGIVPDASSLIIEAKGRDEGKPFIQLIAHPEDLAAHTETKIHPGLLGLWPGAVTVIVPVAGGNTTAFRCPGDPWLREVLRLTGKPVYSTSVNRAGNPALNKIDDIIREFGDIADLVIDDGDQPTSVPSTIVDATGPEYRIIREGAVKIPQSYLKAPL